MDLYKTSEGVVIERLKGERANNYRALVDYALMGPQREIKELAQRYQAIKKSRDSLPPDSHKPPKPPSTSYGTMRQWSSKFNWAARVAEFDRAVDVARQRADLEAKAQSDREWRDWYEGFRVDAKELAEKLIEKANAALAIPLTEQVRTTGPDGAIILINPTRRWTLGNVTSLASTAVELAQMAAKEPARSDITLRGTGKNGAIDVEVGVRLTDAERNQSLQALAEALQSGILGIQASKGEDGEDGEDDETA